MSISAAAYLRISKDDAGEGLGIDRQYELVKSLCEQKGWTLDPRWTIRENNTSAWDDSKPRPGFRRLLRGMESGEVTAVAVYSFDRLARRLRDTAAVLDLVEKHGVKIATVTGGMDLSTAYGRGVAGMLGSLASMEIASMQERLRAKAAQNAQSGRVTNGGRRPYGYTLNRAEVVSDEAEIIREIAGRLLAGESLTGIARDLNSRGVTTGYGVLWRTKKIHEVMSRPRLCGRVVHRGQLVPGVVGQWPAILDEDTYDRVQLAIAARRKIDDNWTMRRQHMLSGFARCGICDAKMMGWKQRSTRWTYRCTASAHLYRDMVLLDEHVRREVSAWALAHPLRVTEWQRPEQADLREQLEAKERRIAELVAAFADGAGSAAVLRQATDRLTAEIAGLRAQQVQRVVEDIDLQAVQFDLGDWDDLTVDDRRAAVGLYVESITVLPSKKRGRGFDPAAVEMRFRDPDRLAFRSVVEA